MKKTQRILAKDIKVSSAIISQWERDETELKGENLLALASAVKCESDYIVCGGSENDVYV